MSLWEKVQVGAKKAGDATKVAAQKTKLRGEMVMIDREIQNRKKTFGVAMYDHIAPLSQSQDFYAASDELTNILRPPLLNAQKEIQALAAKRVKLKEQLAAAEAKRAGAFPEKAETVGQKFVNFGKASVMHSGETKIKAELAIVDSRIKGHKQNFGLDLYATLSEAEDTRGYLPSDRQVRNVYDTCRSDIQRMEANKKKKMEELHALGGMTNDASTPTVVENSSPAQSSVEDKDTSMASNLTYSDSKITNNAAPIQTTSGYTDSASMSDNKSNNDPNQMEDLLL